jgi:ribose-phosphate pyrophosphokinase
MEMLARKRMMLFSGSANEGLAHEVSDLLGIKLTGTESSEFLNGEIYARPAESVRGADCFVLQSHTKPLNFHIMEQLILIDALKRASARKINAVIPFYGYSRQDKKGRPREPITARLVADLLHTAGADRIISVDLHTGQIQGFSDRPFDHLTAQPSFIDYLTKTLNGPITVVSPDTGGVKRADKLSRHLGAEVAFVHKRRDPMQHNQSVALAVVGNVEGRHCLLFDDIIDTGGTIVNAAHLVRDQGALSVRVVATHPVFSNGAHEKLSDPVIEEIIVTNTLPIGTEWASSDKLTVLSIAPLLAEALEAVFAETSVSQIFLGENE